MKLRTGKIVKVAKSSKGKGKVKPTSQESQVSRLRSGKVFRDDNVKKEKFVPLEWLDMELKYEKYVSIYKKKYGTNKPILETSMQQLTNFKKGISKIIENQSKSLDNDHRIIIVKSCVLWLKENINLFFCPGLICDYESLKYLRKHVKWMQYQLDAINDKRILKKYKETDLIQLTKDFNLIHSMWQTI